MQSSGAPIAQPLNFSKKQYLNSNILLCITRFRAFFTALEGESVGSSWLYSSIHYSTWLVPWMVYMFVYIDLESAVKSFAPADSVT